MRTYKVRSLDGVIGRAYDYLRRRGLGEEARELWNEWYVINQDSVCLIAELRLLMLTNGVSLELVGTFDR